MSKFTTYNTSVFRTSNVLVQLGWFVVDLVWLLSILVSRILVLGRSIMLRLVSIVGVRSSSISLDAVIERVVPIPLLVVLFLLTGCRLDQIHAYLILWIKGWTNQWGLFLEVCKGCRSKGINRFLSVQCGRNIHSN